MDFGTFRNLTLARNSGLPTTLDYGGFCLCHSPDDKKFSIWFQLTGQKYQARIVDLNDPHPVGDLSTCPSRRRVHEVPRRPRRRDRDPPSSLSAAPVVLNYHDAADPVCTDDKTACCRGSAQTQGAGVPRRHRLRHGTRTGSHPRASPAACGRMC